MPRHWTLLGLGLVLDVIGLIWVFQGIGLLPGSFMTGQMFWAGAGGVAVVAGMVLVAFAMKHKAENT